MVKVADYAMGAPRGALREVRVGDVVCFKSDYEQSGLVTKIEGDKITLTNPSGFGGEYLRYATETVQRAPDCWVE